MQGPDAVSKYEKQLPDAGRKQREVNTACTDVQRKQRNQMRSPSTPPGMGVRTGQFEKLRSCESGIPGMESVIVCHHAKSRTMAELGSAAHLIRCIASSVSTALSSKDVRTARSVTELKNRGVQEILIDVVDGMVGSSDESGAV
jgi:hypothetical protein